METAAHPHGLSVACQWRPHGRDDGDTPRCWPIGHRGFFVRARESDREPRDQPHGLNQLIADYVQYVMIQYVMIQYEYS